MMHVRSVPDDPTCLVTDLETRSVTSRESVGVEEDGAEGEEVEVEPGQFHLRQLCCHVSVGEEPDSYEQEEDIHVKEIEVKDITEGEDVKETVSLTCEQCGKHFSNLGNKNKHTSSPTACKKRQSSEILSITAEKRRRKTPKTTIVTPLDRELENLVKTSVCSVYAGFRMCQIMGKTSAKHGIILFSCKVNIKCLMALADMTSLALHSPARAKA